MLTKRDLIQVIGKQLNEFEKRFEKRIDAKLDQRFDKFEKKFDKKIDTLALITKKGLDQVDKRFESVEKRLDKIEIEITDIKKRLEQIELRLGSLESKIEQLEKADYQISTTETEDINVLVLDIERVKKRINFLENQIQKIVLKQSSK